MVTSRQKLYNQVRLRVRESHWLIGQTTHLEAALLSIFHLEGTVKHCGLSEQTMEINHAHKNNKDSKT